MTMYATLEEAIDAAREEFLADNPGIDAENANVQQFNAQKYVLQDGDIMWQVEFFADEGEEGECLPMLSGEAAQSVFDGDYDEIEIRQEWQDENTLHEWDDGGNFSLSHRWIPRKDAQQLMSGMNVNHSYGP